MTHGRLTEHSRSYRVVTHDRKGREGKRKGSGGAIHTCNPTRRRHRPVDNGAVATDQGRHGWMGADAPIGGGR